MKPLSASILERAAKAAELLTPSEADQAMRAYLRVRLAGLDTLPGIGPERAVGHLADALQVSEQKLTLALRGGGIGPELAKALGYRKVIRYERVE